MDATDYASVVVTGSGTPPVTLHHSGVGNRYYFTGSRLVLHEDQAQSGVAPNLQIQYNRARWYDPALGRWLQRDPAEYVDGMNLYEHVRGRPLNLLDSSGTCTVGSTCYSFESAVVSGLGGPNVNRLLVAFTAFAEAEAFFVQMKKLDEKLPIPSGTIPGPSYGPSPLPPSAGGELTESIARLVAAYRDSNQLSMWYRYSCKKCKQRWWPASMVCDPYWKITSKIGWTKCNVQLPEAAGVAVGQAVKGFTDEMVGRLAQECTRDAETVASTSCKCDSRCDD